MNKISVGVWAYGALSDRYVGDGYRERLALKDRIARLGKIKGVSGVEITYPGDINETNFDEYAAILKDNGLELSGMGVEIVCDKQWQRGSFTSPDPARRQHTQELVKKSMDFAAKAGVETVSLWLGQDGFDYLMEVDYAAQWNHLIEGLRECADHNPKIKLGLEYKVSEPRLKCLVANGGQTLALALAVGRDNVGATMDVGHAFNAGENPAQIAAILMAQKKLFHLHLNDNYQVADDDMPIGSVHFLHFVELFYWLKKMGYGGWYALDMYPYRDDSDEAIKASIQFIRGVERFVEEKLADFKGSDFSSPSLMLQSLFSKIFA